MTERFSLKDFLFNRGKVEQLAAEILLVYPEFKHKRFVEETVARFPELELKERIRWIREMLHTYLPQSYREAVAVILKALPPPLDPSRTDDDFGDFIYAPYADYIAIYGRTPSDLLFSLQSLHAVTQRFSAEEAIRYFINDFPDETLRILNRWATDKNYHVRRLVSEGTRPKLPWAPKIVIAPRKAIPLLDLLFFDTTRYVTRSVANHMNDISKVDPELAVSTLQRWEESGKQSPKEMEYIIRHSLRTLIKQGNRQAIEFLRLSPEPHLTASEITLSRNPVPIDEILEFSITLTTHADERLIIDHVLYFQGKNGGMTNKKIFKIKQLDVKPGQTITVSKRHKMIRNMTTRTLYPGTHKIEIQVNGMKVAAKEFELID